MCNPMPLSDSDRAFQERGLAVMRRVFRSPDDEAADLVQQRAARFALQLTPYRMRTPDEWRVVVPLTHRQTGDATFPMARTAIVRGREPVDTDRLDA
jgi:hypothetical protein